MSISETRKAWVGFALGVLSPIGVLLASEAELTPRSIAASVVAGVITGLGVFIVRNDQPTTGV